VTRVVGVSCAFSVRRFTEQLRIQDRRSFLRLHGCQLRVAGYRKWRYVVDPCSGTIGDPPSLIEVRPASVRADGQGQYPLHFTCQYHIKPESWSRSPGGWSLIYLSASVRTRRLREDSRNSIWGNRRSIRNRKQR
jgi:hypothetical protein